MKITCPRCKDAGARFLGDRIKCPSCGILHVLIVDLESLKRLYQAFKQQRYDDLTLCNFMHRLEQEIGLRDEHGRLTLIGLEVVVQ